MNETATIDKALLDSISSLEPKVSHGLNLVLKLKNRAQMPALLMDIRQAQRKINAGLGELNFVHFARFLPLHDGSALQVITEFDGPLDPYVLDFAIEIGDVFDTLLSYTEDTAGIVPVREHPDAFLAFVREHNQVRVLNVPWPGEYPLYSGYPERTVLEIVGPRTDLPLPKPDRPAERVELADVQGNILLSYSATRVRHFVVAVADGVAAAAWLAARANGPAGKVPGFTNAELWPANAEPVVMFNVGVTYSGLRALGAKPAELEQFAQAFREGPAVRASANHDLGESAPAHWWLGSPEDAPVHAMLSLYGKPRSAHEAADNATFDVAAVAIADALPAHGFALLATHDADHPRDARIPLGYRDGITGPRLAAASCPGRSRSPNMQPAANPGEFVIGPGLENVYGGPAVSEAATLALNGSYCAVRVLSQDRAGFSTFLATQSKVLGIGEELLAAKLMGRWRDGAPLTLHPTTGLSDPDSLEHERDDFDYGASFEYPNTTEDHWGQRCPVGAHIRRTNPRSARVAGARYSRRLMRRGMTYRRPISGGGTEEGLFGMFICASLERQFEFIQQQWINGDLFAAGIRGTRDPIAGAYREGAEFTFLDDHGVLKRVPLQPWVHTRGSLYLLLPGLSALRSLAGTPLPKHLKAALKPPPKKRTALTLKKGKP